MPDRKLLEELRQAIWSVDFDAGVAHLNKSAWHSFVGESDESSLETKWMAAELFDYAGQYAYAREILSESGPKSIADLIDALHTRDPRRYVEGSDRHAYKQYSLVAIQWGFTFYRMHQYHKAKEIWDRARDFVETSLTSKDYPCHGTLSRMFYGIGLIHRQRYEYSEARKMFSESIDHARRDAERHESAENAKGTALLEYRIAKCLGLGLGWVCYTSGALDLARPLIDTARMLVANKKVEMIKAYVDVVRAELQISEHGNGLPQLTQAIETLNNAYDIFTCHPAYRARTAHELALANLRLSMLSAEPDKTQYCETARSYIEEVKKYAKGNKDGKEDKRWNANALIAETRLCRIQGKWQEAKQSAGDALLMSRDDRFARIEVLIELGQAWMGSARENQDGEQSAEDYHLALDYFEKALSEAYENPKTQAVCHLHMARCYLGLRANNKSSWHVEKWRSLRTGVKNAFVYRLGEAVEDELARLKLPFCIECPTVASAMPDVGKEESRFRGWVTEAALNLIGPDGTTDDAIKLIKKNGKPIRKATFFFWRKRAGLTGAKK
jgi:tetratricopeptide (TPR) repeat protein